MKSMFITPGHRRLMYLACLSGLTSWLTGCTQVFAPRSLPEATLNIQVKPTEQKGVYAIAGQTNLPNHTQMRIIAIRQLQLTTPVATAQPTYAILAYAPVQVEQGAWQTQLNLWAIAPDGHYRETWQMEVERLGLAVTPQSQVQFIATLAPQGVLASLVQQVEAAGLRIPRSLLRTSSEGEPFLQAESVLPVSLPTGSTTPPPVRPEDLNDGWGERYRLVEEPPLPYTLKPENERKTDAPATPGEYLY